MSIPQHILYNTNSTVYLDTLTKLTTATVSIYTDNGTAIVSGATATNSTISTTLASAYSAGDTVITVAAATGISVGSKFWIQDDPEDVLVKKVSGTTITLRRPLMYNHISGATCQGNRLSYTVSAANANTLFWEGRIEWYSNGVLKHVSAVECSKYPLNRLATLQDVFDENPKTRNMLPDDIDMKRLLDLAHEDVLTTIAAVDKVRILTASGRELSRAVVLQFWKNYYRRDTSDDGERLYQRYDNELNNEIKKITAILPADKNQDGVISANENIRMKNVRLSRG